MGGTSEAEEPLRGYGIEVRHEKTHGLMAIDWWQALRGSQATSEIKESGKKFFGIIW